MIDLEQQIQLQIELTKLTPSQRRLYDIIVLYKQDNDGNSPGREEIMAKARMKSRSQYDKILAKLVKVGLLSRSGGSHKDITVVGSEWVPPPIR